MTTVINGTSTSASAPAVVGDDSDTGIFYPTSNVVAIATAGAEIARANSTQLLIGTSTGAGSAAKTEIFASSTNPALFARAAGDISNQYGQALVLSDSAVPNLRANFIVQQIGGRGGLAIGATEVGVTNDRDIYIAYTGGILAVGGGTTVSTSKGAIQLNNTSYGGITFPASQVASSDANTLDDYEEGTFSFNPFFITGQSGSFTNGRNTGYYIKIGKVVHIQGWVTWSAIPASGTTFAINLPFSSISGDDPRGGFAITYSDGFVATGYQIAARTENAASYCVLNRSTSTSLAVNSAFNRGDLSTSSGFMISGSYIANA